MARWLVVVLIGLLIGVQQAVAQQNTPPTPTPETTFYVVKSGDTLGLIASRHHTTISELARLNNLNNPQLIVIGQRLRIPTSDALPTTPIVSTTVVLTPTPNTLTDGTSIEPTAMPTLATPIVTPAFDYGIEFDYLGQPIDSAVVQIAALGMHWGKLEARWSDLEATRGVRDFTQLDAAVDALRLRNLNVLMTITDAPDWSRSTSIENGPPDDMSQFTQFASALAEHYAGRVQAYEIWNEPNLRREWNSSLYPISAEAYALMLRNAYTSIKAVDPNAIVVSAGLAPTGFNDGINAIDDRDFLAALYALGLPQFSDAIGAHPYGYANPPDTRCCAAPGGVMSHYGHPSFYFLDTLEDYRAIMLQYGDQTSLIWITRFGWGTADDSPTPSRNVSYVSYTNLEQQAKYLAQGFELGARQEYVGVMIAYNLNACVAEPDNPEACYYSLIDPTGRHRPAYDLLQTVFQTATGTGGR